MSREFNDLQQAVVAGDESACLLTAVIFSRAQSGTDKERAEVLAQMMSSCDASSWRDVEEGQAEKRRRVSLPDASEPVDELPVGEEDTVGLVGITLRTLKRSRPLTVTSLDTL